MVEQFAISLQIATIVSVVMLICRAFVVQVSAVGAEAVKSVVSTDCEEAFFRREAKTMHTVLFKLHQQFYVLPSLATANLRICTGVESCM
jgi:aspartate/tyrosine/aromatic aminotransferase